MATIKFKNKYDSKKIKREFWTEPNTSEDLTDQSQLYSSNITEMAKKFGIDAIISKANQMNIESEKIKEVLYGHDFSNMFKSKEELLNVKNKLNRVFEKIPAKMRKQLFNDNVTEFVDAYTYNDENKLSELNKVGLVSDTQLESVKEYNNKQRARKQEMQIKENFVNELNKIKGDLYENFKTSGIINFNHNINNSESNKDV